MVIVGPNFAPLVQWLNLHAEFFRRLEFRIELETVLRKNKLL